MINTNDAYSHSFIFSLWNDVVQDDIDYLLPLGFSIDDINRIAQIYNSDDVYLSNYLCQYIEIANYEEFLISLTTIGTT
jgi:hypothetical protein